MKPRIYGASGMRDSSRSWRFDVLRARVSFARSRSHVALCSNELVPRPTSGVKVALVLGRARKTRRTARCLRECGDYNHSIVACQTKKLATSGRLVEFETHGSAREPSVPWVLVLFGLLGLSVAMLSSGRGLNGMFARVALGVLVLAFLWVCLGVRRGTRALASLASTTAPQTCVSAPAHEEEVRARFVLRPVPHVLELHQAKCGPDSARASSMRQGRFTGHELDGFRLGDLIGRGGMGEVYAAHDMCSDRPVAVKLLRFETLGEEDVLTRFKREAKLVASIASPHVVRVLSVSNEGAVFPYIVMERLFGVDLASHLRDRARLSLPEVLCLVEQLALGLEAAHGARVLHRDLKPSNVFRARSRAGDACWKILDFGVSKWLGPSLDPVITKTGWIGTPQYMAPEQIAGDGQLDHRVDLYALCAIAYRALTGVVPFAGAMPGILRSVSERMPTAPSLYLPMHPDMDLVFAIGLAKEPEHRFQRARELAEAYALAAQGALPQRLRSHAQHLLRVYPYATCA